MLTPDLKTSTTRIGEALICSFAGDVHMDNEEQIHRELNRALAAHPGLLVIELSAVGLFTSTALNALLIARRAALDLGVPLVLAAPSPQARRVLEITETDTVFDIAPSIAAALYRTGVSVPGTARQTAPACLN